MRRAVPQPHRDRAVVVVVVWLVLELQGVLPQELQRRVLVVLKEVGREVQVVDH